MCGSCSHALKMCSDMLLLTAAKILGHKNWKKKCERGKEGYAYLKINMIKEEDAVESSGSKYKSA